MSLDPDLRLGLDLRLDFDHGLDLDLGLDLGPSLHHILHYLGMVESSSILVLNSSFFSCTSVGHFSMTPSAFPGVMAGGS